MSKSAKSTKADTIIKLILIFFISLFSFSVGTFVGKQVSDSDYRKLALEEDYKDARGIASIDPKATDLEPESKLTDADIASLTEEFIESEKKGSTHNKNDPGQKKHIAKMKVDKNGYRKIAKVHNQAHAHKGGKAHDHKHMKKASKKSPADRVAEGKAPTADPQQRKPHSVLPNVASSTVGKYTIQVAAYTTEAEAHKHAAHLKAKNGYSAFYMKAVVNQQTWYRVNIGLFENIKSAEMQQKEVLKHPDIKSTYIKKIVK